MTHSWDYDCIVVGGGPGGLVASLYLKRFLRKVLLIQSGTPRAAWIPSTHNLIGYFHGISGPTLLRRLNQQIADLGVPILYATAHVLRWNGGFKVQTSRGAYLTRKVVLATGIEDIQPAVDNVLELRRSGLLRYCPVCDAFEHRHQKLAVFISNEAGLDRALFMIPYARKLHIVAPPGVVSRTKRTHLRKRGIQFIQGPLESMELQRTRQGLWIRAAQRDFGVDAAYVEMGSRVRDEAFKGMKGLRRIKEGYLITTSEQRLSVPGLFAVGDCVNQLGQVSVAAGQAAIAATAVHNDLRTE
jgi:thioredoxin reductase (NADPH)